MANIRVISKSHLAMAYLSHNLAINVVINFVFFPMRTVEEVMFCYNLTLYIYLFMCKA